MINRRGKTYEELYGATKAQEIKAKKTRRIIIKCLICQEELSIIRCRKDTAKFCSKKCEGIWRRGKPSGITGKNKYNCFSIKQAAEKRRGFHPKSEFKKGHKTWITGLTKETDSRVALLAQKVKQNSPVVQKGYTIPEKQRLKMLGRPCPRHIYGNRSYREDLKCSFRSTWEANFARVLNLLGVKWEYERHRFYLDNCSYLPDFYLPGLDLYIEVKGYLRNGNILKKMVINYPNIKIKVLDSESYIILKNKYESKIDDWEN